MNDAQPKHPAGGRSESAYLSPDAVSSLTGLSVHTLAHWRIAGRGPAFLRIGDAGRNCRVLYARHDLDAWLSSCRCPTRDAPASGASRPIKRREASRGGE